MLVLSRKVLEVIVIRNDITITVLEISRNNVRLGIETPEGVPVHRLEVWLKLQLEQPEVTGDRDDSSNPLPGTGEEAA